jgi:DNA-binding NarL/FixJ family response regulator
MNFVPIRVAILDGNEMYCQTLTALMKSGKDYVPVGYCRTLDEIRSLTTREVPDLILVEIDQYEPVAMDFLRVLPTLSVRTRAIATAEIEIRSNIVEAVRLGAKGFILKQSPAELFMKCLEKVYQGEIWLAGRFAAAVLNAFGSITADNKVTGKSELSTREMEVIGHVVQGYKNRDIAEKLFISEKTVKNHLSAIFNKLNVRGRLELTLYAFEKSLFSPHME